MPNISFQQSVSINFVGVNHAELVSLGEKLFGDVSLTYDREIPTLSACRFTGSEVGPSCVLSLVLILVSAMVLQSETRCRLDVNRGTE
jgi:hypothetical protein